MKRISSEIFLQAFRDEWTAQVQQAPAVLTSPEYPAPTSWTRFIEDPGGLLEGVMMRLRRVEPTLAYRQQRYTVDCSYVGGKDLFRGELEYPSEVHCLIEHEHGPNVEEEMWKLIHWRAPLKVLMFYDWNEWEKTNDSRRQWLSAKLTKLCSMLKDVDRYFSENNSTEYLFLVGNRTTPQQPPRWFVATAEAPTTVVFIPS